MKPNTQRSGMEMRATTKSCIDASLRGGRPVSWRHPRRRFRVSPRNAAKRTAGNDLACSGGLSPRRTSCGANGKRLGFFRRWVNVLRRSEVEYNVGPAELEFLVDRSGKVARDPVSAAPVTP